MRRIAVIAAGVILTATAVQADENTVSTQTATPAPVASAPVAAAPQSQPVVYQSQSYRPVQRRQQGFFGRVMDLERRKNAWIRRTFFQ